MSDVTNSGAEVDNDHPTQEVADASVEERELEAGSEDGTGDDDPVPAEDDTEEVEIDGQKYRVPKAIKDGYLRTADYTQKTQEVAARRQELDQREQQLQQQSQTQRANIRAHAQLANIESELETYSKVDWTALYAQDNGLAAQHSHRQNELREAHKQLVGQITQHEQQALAQQNAQRSKQVQESEAVLAREIKDWGPEKASKLFDMGEKVSGIPKQALVNAVIAMPGAAKVLELALIGQQFLAKQTPAPKSTPVVEAKPVTTVGKGKGAPPALDDKVSTDEWMRRREAQLRKRG